MSSRALQSRGKAGTIARVQYLIIAALAAGLGGCGNSAANQSRAASFSGTIIIHEVAWETYSDWSSSGNVGSAPLEELECKLRQRKGVARNVSVESAADAAIVDEVLACIGNTRDYLNGFLPTHIVERRQAGRVEYTLLSFQQRNCVQVRPETIELRVTGLKVDRALQDKFKSLN